MSYHGTSEQGATRPVTEKWTRDKVLQEARRRTKIINVENSKRIQVMLDELLVEAGWSENEFIETLCKDAMTNGLH